jgi:hypothetical protein
VQTIANKILSVLRRKGRGYVFTPHELLNLGSRAAIDQALSRMTRTGEIRRLGRGIYDYPKTSAKLGPLTPSAESIVRALGRKEGVRLQASGARAANALGLSTQVPGQITFLTDGTSRTRNVANYTIRLKRASPRKLLGADKLAGVVLQALRYLGPNGIDQRIIRHLNGMLKDSDKRELQRLAPSAPAWAQHALERIVMPRERPSHVRSSAGQRNHLG